MDISRSERSIQAIIEAASENETAEVVFCWVPDSGGWRVQAWAEMEGHVLDFTESRTPIAIADYYKDMGVTAERCRRFSRVEYFTMVADSGSFGPFDKEFFPGLSSAVDPLA